MKIEIWSDIGCPYCYIAMVRFYKALERFEHKNSVEIHLKSFELEPEIKVNGGETQHQAVMRKYRQGPEGAQRTLDQAKHAATESGITINWDKVITTNSFNAHRLMHFAATHGKAKEMEMRLFKAYFTDGAHIGDRDVLIGLAEELGLDAKAVLENGRFSDEVRIDEYQARSLDINSVPYMLFEDKYAVTGARPEDEFLSMFSQFHHESLKKSIIDMDGSAGCVDGSCSI